MTDNYLCSTCERQIRGGDVRDCTRESARCVSCFGIFDREFIARVATTALQSFSSEQYDSSTFVLAFNLPTSMTIREVVLTHARLDRDGHEQHANAGTLMTVPLKLRLIEAYLAVMNETWSLRPTLHSDLTLTLTIDQAEFDKADLDFLQMHFPREFSSQGGKKRRWNRDQPESAETAFTKSRVSNVLSRIDATIARAYPLRSPSTSCHFSVHWDRSPVWIAGRYCKFSRFLPQSPWAIDESQGVEVGNSVSEIITEKLVHATRAQSSRFIASGREDIDVRMLGSGRPFVVQLENCRSTKALRAGTLAATLEQLAKCINAGGDVQVKGLKRITKQQVGPISVGQEEKRKWYTALCASSEAISLARLQDLATRVPIEIQQRTPVRVLKRRPLLDRMRNVFAIHAIALDDPVHRFLLRLETQAGTYVKEFIHGDFGRTRPSLRDLLSMSYGHLEILELDVEHVDLQWPPEGSNEAVLFR